jgi:hypothetical protein
VPGISLRPEPTRQAPGTFDQLTMLELTALSATLRRGRSRARQAALRSRSPLEIWDFVRLSGLLVNLENEAIQARAPLLLQSRWLAGPWLQLGTGAPHGQLGQLRLREVGHLPQMQDGQAVEHGAKTDREVIDLSSRPERP